MCRKGKVFVTIEWGREKRRRSVVGEEKREREREELAREERKAGGYIYKNTRGGMV